MDAAQLATFKADIEGNTNQTVIDALAVGDAGVIANWYSTETAGYWVYKNLVSLDEVAEAIELDDVANMTSGDNQRLQVFFQIRQGGVFANKATDRDGFDDIFSAAAGDDSQQALAALWKRKANNVEELFATGTGTEGDPAVMGYEGPVSYQVVAQALNS